MNAAFRASPAARSVAALLLVWALGGPVPARAQPPGPVRYTEAIRHSVRAAVQLPGSVESRRSGVVASEVAGLVVQLLAEPGDRVERDAPLARLRQINFELQLRAAEGRLKEARARLDQAERHLERARELFDDAVISQGDLDDAFSEDAAWQGRVDQTSAEIERLRVDLERSVIRAPYPGAVVAKRTEVGQWLAVGDPVIELVSLDEIDVRAEVPERYFDLLDVGTEAQVRLEALPGAAITGRVRAIIPRADPRARSFPVKVGIPNREGRIGVGMLATVLLPVGDTIDAVLVPKDSVVRQGPAETVFRIAEDQTVAPVPIETGQGVGAWVVVHSGLAAGARVVTRGNERLRPGQSVEAELLEYPDP